MKRARLLAFVLTAAMATTVFLGGTVARYQTTASIDDTATVAKWGVKLTMAGDLYGLNYENVGHANSNKPHYGVITTDATIDGFTVEADNQSDTVDRVAPGTNGDAFKIALTGDTEVDVLITATITAQDIYLKEGKYAILQPITVESETEFAAMTSGTNRLYKIDGSGNVTEATMPGSFPATDLFVLQNKAVVDSDGYYPVKHSLTGSTSTKITEIAADLAKRINNSASDADGVATDADVAFNNVTKSIEANIDLNVATYGVDLDNEKITWSWAIGTSDNDNACDTVLGTLMAGDTSVKVILISNDSLGSFAATVLEVSDNLVMNGSDEVGSLKTSFYISITVSQED